MRIAVVGGGPGGLFFATLIRRADPSVEVTVFERNRADDTFGFGVVFSDRTLAGIHEADPVLREALTDARPALGRDRGPAQGRAHPLRRQRDGRRRPAHPARAACRPAPGDVGAELRFSTEVDPATTWPATTSSSPPTAPARGSASSSSAARTSASTVETATAKFIWFGTDYLFDGLTLRARARPGRGVRGARLPDLATSVSHVHRGDRRGVLARGRPGRVRRRPSRPGASDMVTKDYLEKLFADQIDGQRLLVNNSRWGNFRTRRTRRWHALGPRPVALLGDAVHTAHFSVGSGHQDGDGGRGRAGRARWPSTRTTCRRRWPPTRPRPSRRCARSRTRRGPAWPGGSTSAATTTCSSPGSSPTTSCPAASPTPGWPGATRTSSPPATAAGSTRTARSRWTPRSSTCGWSRAGPAGRGRRRAEARRRRARPRRSLPLRDDPQPGPWGALLAAPDAEAGLPAAFARLAEPPGSTPRPALVAVHGGTALTRTLVCEQARMHDAAARAARRPRRPDLATAP